MTTVYIMPATRHVWFSCQLKSIFLKLFPSFRFNNETKKSLNDTVKVFVGYQFFEFLKIGFQQKVRVRRQKQNKTKTDFD